MFEYNFKTCKIVTFEILRQDIFDIFPIIFIWAFILTEKTEGKI